MRQTIAALAAGSLFGLGLVISRMVDPLKVQAFLDVAGDWDPSLAFVMAAAIPSAAIGLALGRRAEKPFFVPAFVQPPVSPVDVRLIAGAALFGAGWGLVGYCPGPALASIGNGAPGTLIFVIAMAVGMVVHRLLPRSRPWTSGKLSHPRS